jgi:hypothetical protein
MTGISRATAAPWVQIEIPLDTVGYEHLSFTAWTPVRILTEPRRISLLVNLFPLLIAEVETAGGTFFLRGKYNYGCGMLNT